MTERVYELRLFDRTLATFGITDSPFGPESRLIDYDHDAERLMPCGFVPTDEGVWRWMEMRSIPANRRNAARICAELGFVLGDVEALYRTSLGLSLNDSYWVVPEGFEGRFDDYNLYDNPFSEAIGALAVAGEQHIGPFTGNTPELTTDGTLRKGWRILDGKRVLYKGASDGYAPGEPTSEYLASLVARDLGLDAVRYDIDTWEGETCSTCEDFATKDVSYVPFAVATGKTDLAGALWWFGRLGNEHFEHFCDMLTLDALLCNTDRHLTNFGLLRDNATGFALRLAPIFDNGRALFPNVAEDDVGQFLLEARMHGPAFGGRSFEELLARIMGERQRELLERAADRGIIGNVHIRARRVAALDAFMRERARDLAQTPIVDHAELMMAVESAMARRPTRDDEAHRL